MAETMDRWAVPCDVKDLDIVFGLVELSKFPTREEIPDEFWRGYGVWNKVFNQWFFKGIDPIIFVPKPGIDKKKALQHLAGMMGSFAPKHEHKEAAVSYLMSRWFEEPTGLSR